MAARSAVVSAIASRKKDFYRHQVVLCGGDQGRLSKVLGGLVQRKDAPVLPSSQSDLELASSFSDFFSEKILRIRSELDLDMTNPSRASPGRERFRAAGICCHLDSDVVRRNAQLAR